MKKTRAGHAHVTAHKAEVIHLKRDAKSAGPEQTVIQAANVLSDGAETSFTPHKIIQLQRLIGNQAVMQMLDKRNRSSSSVQRLPDQLEGAMGTVFGERLSGINVHTDAHAHQVARAANADATTIDGDIYFQAGAYRPGTADGNALIAREVAHIQRAKLTGVPHARPSAEASDVAKRDAEGVAELVQMMGSDPAHVLQPITTQPTAIQRNILQRDPNASKMRGAGVITSKVVQGIFTTVLGPIGLVWRWPLIQKNLGEITGWEQTGTRKGKKEDRWRYGEGPLSTVMRWTAAISELMKELTIWLGFGTFIAAIVSAATHGVAAPVFAGLLIATAVTGGLHAVLRGILVAFNAIRLWFTNAGSDKTKAAYIKHQMVSDGMEGIGAAITSVLSAIGGAGLGSVGGDLANAAGHSTTATATEAADPAGRLAGFGLGAATMGLTQNVGGNTLKEGGKEFVKPDTKLTGFFGDTFKKKSAIIKSDDLGGFGKDATEIRNNYTTKRGFTFWGKKEQPAPVQAPVQSPVVQSADAQDALAKSAEVLRASNRNVVDQGVQSSEGLKQSDKLASITPSLRDSAEKVGSVQMEMAQTEAKGMSFSKDIPKLVDEAVGKDESKLNTLSIQMDEGLKRADEPALERIDRPYGGGGDGTISTKRTDTIQREGVFSTVSEWFSSKLSSLKAGAIRLNNKLMKGVIKYAGKLNKSEAERQAVLVELKQANDFAATNAKDERQNDAMFETYQAKASQLDMNVQVLAEKENG